MLEILGLLLPAISGVLNKIIPDANARQLAQDEITKALISQQAEVEKAIAEAAKAQAQVNLKEAESPSIFVAGWRPAVGWTCCLGCFYGFIGQPMFTWMSAIFHGPAAPVLDMPTLLGLLTGMLGMGGMRTLETVQGVATQSLATPTVKKK